MPGDDATQRSHYGDTITSSLFWLLQYREGVEHGKEKEKKKNLPHERRNIPMERTVRNRDEHFMQNLLAWAWSENLSHIYRDTGVKIAVQ